MPDGLYLWKTIKFHQSYQFLQFSKSHDSFQISIAGPHAIRRKLN